MDESEKPSVDAKGFGLFAMQDIAEHRLITLYLGDIFTTDKGKNNAIGNVNYTLMSNVTHNDYNGWRKNKKKVMYVVPKLKSEKWKENVDEMYIGGHLINDYHGMHKRSTNVVFSFLIYSVQKIKAGDELLVNYYSRKKFELE